MHPDFERASNLTKTIIGSAIEVHKDKGPGLLENIYEWCLTKEFFLRKLKWVNQKNVIIDYKGFHKEEPLVFDILVENCLLLELKSVERVLPIHKAQLLSYMKLLNIPVGLLINFNKTKLTNGVSRMILKGADS